LSSRFLPMSDKGTPDTPSMRAAERAHRKPFHFVRKSLLLVALGLFGTAGARAVVQPPEKPAVYTAKSVLPLPEMETLSEAVSADPFISETVIRRGDTLADLLQRRSEEHTSELQSRENLVCRLLLEKKKRNYSVT